MFSALSDVFQSTHPHGVRRTRMVLYWGCLFCFNPRTHTGCDALQYLGFPVAEEFQSTHPHGVRRRHHVWEYLFLRCVSIHAPTRGATEVNQAFLEPDTVSIHAPTRGATARYSRNINASLRFNPRTHTGCDSATDFGSSLSRKFQSTHPHGVRLFIERSKGKKIAVSIHAPTRGATLSG